MDRGSRCPQCGFRTEQLLIACPRCRRPLSHEHCVKCGRCPGRKEDFIKQAQGKKPDSFIKIP